MWQAIKIGEQDYFFQCASSENDIHYYFYNLMEVWSEQCSFHDIMQRAKDLNKRISYDRDTVLKTIKSTTPTTVTLKAAEGGHVLVLKYHIVGRPFNFEWKLKPLPADDFQKLVTYPLFMSIHYLAEQIRELKDTIKKKDIEIEQYKVEGAVLQRKTVTTSKFNEDSFNKRYEKINDISKSFLDISERVKGCFPNIDITSNNEPDTIDKPDGSSLFVSNEKLKRSPNKSKKRKFFETRRLRMESLHKAKQETMDFQSSQSQTPPTDELAEIFQSLDELNAKRLASTTL